MDTIQSLIECQNVKRTMIICLYIHLWIIFWQKLNKLLIIQSDLTISECYKISPRSTFSTGDSKVKAIIQADLINYECVKGKQRYACQCLTSSIIDGFHWITFNYSLASKEWCSLTCQISFNVFINYAVYCVLTFFNSRHWTVCVLKRGISRLSRDVDFYLPNSLFLEICNDFWERYEEYNVVCSF